MNVNKARYTCALFGLTVTLFLTSGCVVVVSTGCDWERSPAVWTEEPYRFPWKPPG